MPWTSTNVCIDVEVMDVLSQLPVEAVIEYLEGLGYEVSK